MRRVLIAGLVALISAGTALGEDDFAKDNDETLLARMIYGEARGEELEERIAVGYTAVNRANDGVKWNGTDIRSVVLKPKQYSCFNEDDVNREKLLNPEKDDAKTWEECLDVAEGILNGKYEDPTQGATHYFNPKLCQPSWAKKMEKIGRIKTKLGESKHEFYREKQQKLSFMDAALVNEWATENKAYRIAA